jgi:hypothetical protein
MQGAFQWIVADYCLAANNQVHQSLMDLIGFWGRGWTGRNLESIPTGRGIT